MSTISYFQRYSQKENAATNNTLLLLRHIYRERPTKFEALIEALTEDDNSIRIGPHFRQQVKVKNSIPDGGISQTSFEIMIEAKRGSKLDLAQISEHARGLSEKIAQEKILFTLTRSRPGLTQLDKLKKIQREFGISISSITYEDILHAARSITADHETDLNDILLDYEDYLSSSGLLQEKDFMYVIPAGTSWNENLEFGLYFEPQGRWSKRAAKYIGLYRDKSVRYLCPISKIVEGQFIDGEFSAHSAQFSSEDKIRIEDAIKACSYYADLKLSPFRFYLFDEIHETDFKKISKGGVYGNRKIYLEAVISNAKKLNDSAIAEQLRSKTFE